MIEPRHHFVDARHAGHVRPRRPSHHDDRQPKVARRRDLAVGRRATAVLRYDHVDAMLQEQRMLGALFERAARDYGDTKLPDGETVAEKAESELFGIRHLSVGKVAPDIDGQDQDGRRFKLSDYRGKVVLLDFWHQQ